MKRCEYILYFKPNEITETSSAAKYGGAVAMGAAALFVLLNVGGIFNGFKLIELFFRSLNGMSRFMGGNDIIIFILALICHLLVPVFGVVALIGFLQGNKPNLSCIIALIASILGLFACFAADWNATAEVLGVIGCIVGLIFCAKVNVEETF